MAIIKFISKWTVAMYHKSLVWVGREHGWIKGPSQNGLRDGMVRSSARWVTGWSALSLDQGFLAGIIMLKKWEARLQYWLRAFREGCCGFLSFWQGVGVVFPIWVENWSFYQCLWVAKSSRHPLKKKKEKRFYFYFNNVDFPSMVPRALRWDSAYCYELTVEATV